MANEINEKEELEAIIQTIDMTPEQQVAFDKYIGEFLTEYKTNMQKKIVEEVTDTLTREYNEKAKLFEERLRKSLEEDVSVEVSEKLKTEFDEKLKVELDKQLKEAVDVLNDYYLSRYELFCQETAGEIESALKEHQEESPEVNAFRQIVSNVSPFISEGQDSKKLIDILEAQDKTIKALQVELEKSTKEKVIAECISVLPEGMRDNMKKFLEESCETAEEVVDKFEHAVEFIKNSDELMESDDMDEDEEDHEDHEDEDHDEDEDDMGGEDEEDDDHDEDAEDEDEDFDHEDEESDEEEKEEHEEGDEDEDEGSDEDEEDSFEEDGFEEEGEKKN